MITYGSLTVMLLDIIAGEVFGVASFSRWMFSTEFAIESVYFLGELVGVPILLIKLILGVILLILFIICYSRYSHPFSLTSSFSVIGIIFVS